MSRPHDCRYRTRVAKHTPPVTGGCSGQSSVETRSTSIATRKITPATLLRHSNRHHGSSNGKVAKSSFAWLALVSFTRLVDQADMKTSAPVSALRYHSGPSWAALIQHLGSIPKAVQYSTTRCSRRFAGWPRFLFPPTISPRMTMLGRRSSCMRATRPA